MRCEFAGTSRLLTPSGDSASTTALTMAGSAPTVPASPAPALLLRLQPTGHCTKTCALLFCLQRLHCWRRSALGTLTIRNVEPELQKRLRVRAAQNGRSMEAELRQILKDVLRSNDDEPEISLAEAIRRRFAPFGGVDDLVLPPREPAREPPEFKD
jgi:antitoxin FitA